MRVRSQTLEHKRQSSTLLFKLIKNSYGIRTRRARVPLNSVQCHPELALIEQIPLHGSSQSENLVWLPRQRTEEFLRTQLECFGVNLFLHCLAPWMSSSSRPGSGWLTRGNRWICTFYSSTTSSSRNWLALDVVIVASNYIGSRSSSVRNTGVDWFELNGILRTQTLQSRHQRATVAAIGGQEKRIKGNRLL